MFGNGVMIGMIVVIIKTAQRTILKVLTTARSVCFVAVVGATMLRTVVLLIVTTTARVTAATIWTSALPAVQNDIRSCVELARLWRGLEIE